MELSEQPFYPCENSHKSLVGWGLFGSVSRAWSNGKEKISYLHRIQNTGRPAHYYVHAWKKFCHIVMTPWRGQRVLRRARPFETPLHAMYKQARLSSTVGMASLICAFKFWSRVIFAVLSAYAHRKKSSGVMSCNWWWGGCKPLHHL
jgi:hypothetical protein